MSSGRFPALGRLSPDPPEELVEAAVAERRCAGAAAVDDLAGCQPLAQARRGQRAGRDADGAAADVARVVRVGAPTEQEAAFARERLRSRVRAAGERAAVHGL